jgi:hypothetical protein
MPGTGDLHFGLIPTPFHDPSLMELEQFRV